MANELEQALAYFERHQHVVDAVPSARHGCTLAAAVRELQDRTGCQACLDREHAQRQRAERAEAALAVMRAIQHRWISS